MEKVVTLDQKESVRLDADRLGALVGQLGDRNAEEVVCRAIEELAVRLSNCDRMWRRQDWVGLRKSARSLVAIAEQIGMSALARVANDVTGAVDSGDHVAASATLFRLIRVGERSLAAVWDQQDLSI
ncbi:hypothetical protein [Ruegeria marisrubri]|uniref:hypothetical protein n=1 Tax=Ruegeria marisrubri TaxID=1685379 RepID=UPI003B838F0D